MNKMMSLIAVLLLTTSLFSATYYVNSSTGANLAGRDGSKDYPWKTISYALVRVTAGSTLDITGSFLLTADSLAATEGITISKNITIKGHGMGVTFVDATGNSTRVFYVESGIAANFEGITVRNGSDDDGAGFYANDGSSVTLEKIEVTANSATVSGGGIFSMGSLNMNNSRISYNNSDSKGAGIYIINNNMRLTNSTISYNHSSDGSGGIYSLSYDLSAPQEIYFENSTVSGNYGTEGAVYFYFNSLNTSILTGVKIVNCTIAENTGTYSLQLYNNLSAYSSAVDLSVTNSIFDNYDCASEYSSVTFNGAITNFSRSYTISADNSMPLGTTNSNLNYIYPGLLPLDNNGGYTETHGLERTSPAANAIPVSAGTTDYNGAPLTDQRGIGIVSGFKDIGAYESQLVSSYKYYVSNVSGSDSNSGTVSYPWKTLSHALSHTAYNDTLKLEGNFLMSEDAGASESYIIKKSINIIGDGADQTVIEGKPGWRIFDVNLDVSLNLKDISLKNGEAVNAYGGGILSQGNLYLNGVEITDCESGYKGGAIHAEYNGRDTAEIVIDNSTIAENTSIYDGGAGLSFRAYSEMFVSITNSTIALNEADEYGAGIFLHSISENYMPSNIVAALKSVNVSGNTSLSGRVNGIHAFTNATGTGVFSNIDLIFDNSIMANGETLNYGVTNYSGTGTVNLYRSYSICQDATMSITGSGNLNSTDPLLAPLDYYNSGHTRTNALYEGSPAIDAIDISAGVADYNGAPLLDQNGIAIINNMKDIGPFEGFLVTSLEIPQNVISSVAGSTLTLTWDAVTGADSYDIYSSADPYGVFNPAGNSISTSWNTTVTTDSKMFYYIVAKRSK
ncbi:MAG: hypothetical protein JW995_02485 [Melioribacteraceae bacterium]|nr:hypothetical protein [Melioribacteraceae bacterium]